MNAIAWNRVSLQFSGQSIINDFSAVIPSGSKAAIIGPNGSGKTTVLRLATGYYFPTTGEVDILGARLGEIDIASLRRNIGVFDATSPWGFDERVNLLEAVLTGFFGNLAPWFNQPNEAMIAAAEAQLQAVGLGSKTRQPFPTLSTGEIRRALLARVLLQQPKILFLDEPTAGLDIAGREMFLACLENAIADSPAMTVVMVTHWLEDLLPATDWVVLLGRSSTVIAGKTMDVLNDEEVSRAFGCPVKVEQSAGRWNWRVPAGAWRELRNQQ